MVFSNREVVRRINEQFIPVALKAAHVNNPPTGIEGKLYTEIGHSKPAPQGICTLNSDGKVLAWALSFDDDANIVAFLDHVVKRFETSPAGPQPVTAERFRKFPSQKLPDVPDNGRRLAVPHEHHQSDRCPAHSKLAPGTLVGRIVGRRLDETGTPVADTIRQENYMEARFKIPVTAQNELAEAADRSDEQRFRIPDRLVRSLVEPAFLGQLDVNPLVATPGSENVFQSWEFWGEVEEPQTNATNGDVLAIRITGKSDVEGGHYRGQNPSGDGRSWEHRVTLDWQGYVDLQGNRIRRLEMFAAGDERLRWGNAQLLATSESDAEHLMAGHPIDFESKVRYGLVARCDE